MKSSHELRHAPEEPKSLDQDTQSGQTDLRGPTSDTMLVVDENRELWVSGTALQYLEDGRHGAWMKRARFTNRVSPNTDTFSPIRGSDVFRMHSDSTVIDGSRPLAGQRGRDPRAGISI